MKLASFTCSKLAACCGVLEASPMVIGFDAVHRWVSPFKRLAFKTEAASARSAQSTF